MRDEQSASYALAACALARVEPSAVCAHVRAHGVRAWRLAACVGSQYVAERRVRPPYRRCVFSRVFKKMFNTLCVLDGNFYFTRGNGRDSGLRVQGSYPAHSARCIIIRE